MTEKEEDLRLQLEAFQAQARRLAVDNTRLLVEQAEQAQRIGVMQADHARMVAGLVAERNAAERQSWREAALARAAEKRAEEALALVRQGGGFK